MSHSRHEGHAFLALVRHAQSTWLAEGRFQGRSDPPLSELGHRQAALVAGRLRDIAAPPALPLPDTPPVAIHHSPSARAAETAVAIARAQDTTVPLVAAEALIELSQGDWEGLTHREVEARWPDELKAWRATPWAANAPGGESLTDASRRVARAVEAMKAELDPPTGSPRWLIAVTHDGVLRLTLMHLLDIGLERFWAFPFPLAGVTVVEVGSGVGRLHAHALVGHLAPLETAALSDTRTGSDRRGAL